MSKKPDERDRPATTPTSFPQVTPALPSGDYSYVLEIVMRPQESVGRLTEAVGSLKEQSKAQSEKLDGIGKDVHAAKVVIGVVGALIAVVAGLFAWVVNTYIATHPAR